MGSAMKRVEIQEAAFTEVHNHKRPVRAGDVQRNEEEVQRGDVNLSSGRPSGHIRVATAIALSTAKFRPEEGIGNPATCGAALTPSVFQH